MHTGAPSRSLLKLAVIVGYAVLMMASLLGSSAPQAQSSPASSVTVASNLTVSPAILEFGFQVVLPPDGLPSKPKNITLSVAKNQPQPVTIEQPLMVSDPAGPPAQFIIQPNNCSVIAPGTSCPVPIVFQPNGARQRKAVLLITSNANNGVQSSGLIGHGKQGMLSINPRSLSFPVANVGALPTSSKPITLTNKNAVQLTIHGVSSSNPGVFQVTDSCPSTLQPSAKCTISASFMADRNGVINGSITIVDNAAGPNRIGLSGSGRGGPTATRTATPTRTPTPTATRSPSAPFPMRAFPAIH
jgi:hypothetical protein